MLLLNAAPAAAQAPAWQWGLQSTNPTPADGSEISAVEVATDAAGRAYVAGSFRNHAGSSAAATRAFAGAGTVGPGLGGYVAQATASGQWAWVTAAVPLGFAPNGGALAEVSGLAVSGAGDVYITGIAYGSSVRVGSVSQTLGTLGAGLYVAKLNAAGVCQWVRTVEGSFGDATLATDPSTGGVVLAGGYSGTVTVGSITLPTSNTTAGRSLWVARLSATGQWLTAAASTGPTGVRQTTYVAVGPAGQVAVAGSQDAGRLVFGTHALVVPTGVDGAYFVAQLSPTNQWDWANGGSGSRASIAFGVAYAGNGTLWATGRGMNGTLVGSTTLVAPVSTTRDDFAGFVGRLSATGQWTTVGQLSPSASGLAAFGPVTVDAAGNAVLLGGLVGFGGPVQGQLGNLTLTTPAGELLLFVAGFNGAGQWRYAATVPQPGLADGFSPNAIALAGPSNLYMAGNLRGGLTLGNSTLTGSYNPAASFLVYGDVVLGKLINANLTAARAGVAAGAVSIFPSPAHAAATLRLPAPASGALKFALLDGLGRTVRTFAVPAGASDATLDLRGLSAGLYGLRGQDISVRLVIE